MTAKKNSLDKRFRAPLNIEEEPLVFDAFNTPTKEIKGVKNKSEDSNVGEQVDSKESEPKKEGVTNKKAPNKKNDVLTESAERGKHLKFSKFEDYKVDPGKNEGTVTKTFTLDNVSNAKLTKISLALDVPLRVLLSNLIDEFYSKYDKDIKKQLMRNLDM